MAHQGPKKKAKLAVWDTSDPEGLGCLVRCFLEWMLVSGYTEQSFKSRKYLLNSFLHWSEERGLRRVGELTKAIMERYQRWLYHYRKKDGQPLSFQSQRSFLGSVKMFCKWLSKNNYLLYNPASELEMPRVSHRLPKHVLTVSEAEQVINQPDMKEPLALRDRAILETLYSTGIRRMEIVNLRLYDLDRERGSLMVREGKGRKDRLIPIGERAVHWIGKYLDELRSSLVRGPDSGYLFLSSTGDKFSLGGITRLVREYVEKAGLKKNGACHLFRHTMATLMLENGADIRFIQAMLGHSALSTTEIYTQVTIKKLKEIHTATHPAKMKRKRVQC